MPYPEPFLRCHFWTPLGFFFILFSTFVSFILCGQGFNCRRLRFDVLYEKLLCNFAPSLNFYASRNCVDGFQILIYIYNTFKINFASTLKINLNDLCYTRKFSTIESNWLKFEVLIGSPVECYAKSCRYSAAVDSRVVRVEIVEILFYCTSTASIDYKFDSM